MKKTDEVFQSAIEDKKIPILTLDNKWHRLFTQAQTEIPAEVRRGEEQLNELIRKQGKLNTESKEIRKLKKQLMTEIMELADSTGGNPGAAAEKKMEDNRRLINECNEKLDDYSRELRLLPEEIARINQKLMLITMDICYRRIAEHTREIDGIDRWVRDIRVEIKKKLIRKEESEKAVFDLYSYMHDIFGAEVIELFDMKYNPEERQKARMEKAAKRKAASGQKGIEVKKV